MRYTEIVDQLRLRPLFLNQEPDNIPGYSVSADIEEAVRKRLRHVRSISYYRIMPYPDDSSADLATPWFAARKQEQARAHGGTELGKWARQVLDALPAGQVTLLSLSVEGCALAGAVAALRLGTTNWAHVNLGREQPERPGTLVILEPVHLSDGILKTLERVLPDATVIDGLVTRPAVAAA